MSNLYLVCDRLRVIPDLDWSNKRANRIRTRNKKDSGYLYFFTLKLHDYIVHLAHKPQTQTESRRKILNYIIT